MQSLSHFRPLSFEVLEPRQVLATMQVGGILYAQAVADDVGFALHGVRLERSSEVIPGTLSVTNLRAEEGARWAEITGSSTVSVNSGVSAQGRPSHTIQGSMTGIWSRSAAIPRHDIGAYIATRVDYAFDRPQDIVGAELEYRWTSNGLGPSTFRLEIPNYVWEGLRLPKDTRNFFQYDQPIYLDTQGYVYIKTGTVVSYGYASPPAYGPSEFSLEWRISFLEAQPTARVRSLTFSGPDAHQLIPDTVTGR